MLSYTSCVRECSVRKFQKFFFILTISISFCNDIAVFSCKTSGRVQGLRYLLVHDVKHLRADNVYHRVLCH